MDGTNVPICLVYFATNVPKLGKNGLTLAKILNSSLPRQLFSNHQNSNDMKNPLIILLSLALIIALSIGCCDEDGPQFETIDFNATFFTDQISLVPDSTGSRCAPPYVVVNTQAGSGSEPTIGNFTTSMTFCVNPNNFEYTDINAVMAAEDGDKLFLGGGGQVIPTTEPGYDFEFKDPFTIVGGTGRFEGATGSGMTDSYHKAAIGRTDHIWSGTITLKK